MAQSRVGTLLLEADRRVPGSIDAVQGTVTCIADAQNAPPGSDPAISDVLDDLAEVALRTGAEVIVLEAARMPSKPVPRPYSGISEPGLRPKANHSAARARPLGRGMNPPISK